MKVNGYAAIEPKAKLTPYSYELGKIGTEQVDIKVFYCGKNVVERKINIGSTRIISKYITNMIVFWDNFYANDYCPRKLFLGPWLNRSKHLSIMINPTGLIETDILIIDIIGESYNECNIRQWKKILIKHDVPLDFFKIAKYFKSPFFTSNPNFKKNPKTRNGLYGVLAAVTHAKCNLNI